MFWDARELINCQPISTECCINIIENTLRRYLLRSIHISNITIRNRTLFPFCGKRITKKLLIRFTCAANRKYRRKFARKKDKTTLIDWPLFFPNWGRGYTRDFLAGKCRIKFYVFCRMSRKFAKGQKSDELISNFRICFTVSLCMSNYLC